MTAAGRLGRLAALLLVPALARGWDWTTNVESTFDCETHRNPIQLYKEELFKCKGGADNGKECDSDADCTGGKCKKELADFFGVEELDIVTGKYTLVYKFPWAEANAFAFLDKNDDGEKVYAFARRRRPARRSRRRRRRRRRRPGRRPGRRRRPIPTTTPRRPRWRRPRRR